MNKRVSTVGLIKFLTHDSSKQTIRSRFEIQLTIYPVKLTLGLGDSKDRIVKKRWWQIPVFVGRRAKILEDPLQNLPLELRERQIKDVVIPETHSDNSFNWGSSTFLHLHVIPLTGIQDCLGLQSQVPLSFAGNATQQSLLCQNACNMFSTLMIVFSHPPYSGLSYGTEKSYLLLCAFIARVSNVRY